MNPVAIHRSALEQLNLLTPEIPAGRFPPCCHDVPRLLVTAVQYVVPSVASAKHSTFDKHSAETRFTAPDGEDICCQRFPPSRVRTTTPAREGTAVDPTAMQDLAVGHDIEFKTVGVEVTTFSIDHDSPAFFVTSTTARDAVADGGIADGGGDPTAKQVVTVGHATAFSLPVPRGAGLPTMLSPADPFVPLPTPIDAPPDVVQAATISPADETREALSNQRFPAVNDRRRVPTTTPSSRSRSSGPTIRLPSHR